MSKDTKIKVGQYSIDKARLFENDRGMIGFDLVIEFDGKEIGNSWHDGNGLTYSYFISPEFAQHREIVTDRLIDALLEANGL